MHAITVRLPTPFPPSHVNGYLFPDEPVTIVDTGPAVPTTLPVWLGALAEHGLRPDDVEQIVLTHQHWDHIGAAEQMREVTGAPVLAPVGVAPYVSDFAASIEQEVAFYAALMEAHAVPTGRAAEALAVFDALPGFVGRTELDIALVEGDELRAGEHLLRVLARPGHSVSDTLFVDLDAGEALVGDHLLEVSSPVVMPPVELVAGRTGGKSGTGTLLRSGVPEMLDSLRRTDELGLSLALPGHGAPVRDVSAAVARALAFYRRHDEPILAALARGPAGVWELVLARDSDVRGGDALYKLASTLGSLELLLAEGRVVQLADAGGGPPRFALSPA